MCLQLDVSSLTSVRKFVSNFTMKKRKLHVLINNAAIKLSDDDRTVKPTHDKIEVTMATNHIGNAFLLFSRMQLTCYITDLLLLLGTCQ